MFSYMRANFCPPPPSREECRLKDGLELAKAVFHGTQASPRDVALWVIQWVEQFDEGKA